MPFVEMSARKSRISAFCHSKLSFPEDGSTDMQMNPASILRYIVVKCFEYEIYSGKFKNVSLQWKT